MEEFMVISNLLDIVKIANMPFSTLTRAFLPTALAPPRTHLTGDPTPQTLDSPRRGPPTRMHLLCVRISIAFRPFSLHMPVQNGRRLPITVCQSKGNFYIAYFSRLLDPRGTGWLWPNAVIRFPHQLSALFARF
jgi:hypothetical protein